MSRPACARWEACRHRTSDEVGASRGVWAAPGRPEPEGDSQAGQLERGARVARAARVLRGARAHGNGGRRRGRFSGRPRRARRRAQRRARRVGPRRRPRLEDQRHDRVPVGTSARPCMLAMPRVNAARLCAGCARSKIFRCQAHRALCYRCGAGLPSSCKPRLGAEARSCTLRVPAPRGRERRPARAAGCRCRCGRCLARRPTRTATRCTARTTRAPRWPSTRRARAWARAPGGCAWTPCSPARCSTSWSRRRRGVSAPRPTSAGACWTG
jgi:hypothetical protein